MVIEKESKWVIHLPPDCVICQALVNTYDEDASALEQLHHLVILKGHIEKSHPELEVEEGDRCDKGA